jgi:hypothetical protein
MVVITTTASGSRTSGTLLTRLGRLDVTHAGGGVERMEAPSAAENRKNPYPGDHFLDRGRFREVGET